ncbi:MAG: hypothetical protein BA863_10360 [Desulfovibrio sp. S3730MH75]|nr:MAG: hypothetical protein BA863_10360 [Desulfovibrio sp. S3730MH75]
MNLYQARKGRKVEVLVIVRDSESRRSVWLPGVITSRNFYRGIVRVELEGEDGKNFRVTVPCANDFELPRIRER